MRVLITGVAGFSGRHLVQSLRRSASCWILGLDSVSELHREISVDSYATVDVCDVHSVGLLVREAKPDFVFHLAGAQRGDACTMIETNVVGTLRVLEALRAEAPHARCLLVGSAAEYGHVPYERLPITEREPPQPCGVYGASKFSATLLGLEYAKAYRLHVAVVRPFNLVGPGVPESMVVGAIVSRLVSAVRGEHDTVIKVGNLDTVRDFLDVRDAVDAYFRILETGMSGEVYNLCSGVPTTIRSVVDTLIELAPGEVRIEVDPALLRHGEIQASYGSWAKAAGAFGFRPTTPLSQSLEATWTHVWSKKEG